MKVEVWKVLDDGSEVKRVDCSLEALTVNTGGDLLDNDLVE